MLLQQRYFVVYRAGTLRTVDLRDELDPSTSGGSVFLPFASKRFQMGGSQSHVREARP